MKLRRVLLDRRLLLGVGAALLIGGWATTWFAHERTDFFIKWTRDDALYRWQAPSGIISALGVVLIGMGAGLIAFALLRRAKGGER